MARDRRKERKRESDREGKKYEEMEKNREIGE